MHDMLPANGELELLTRLRRDLHRIPELDTELPKTISYIEAELGAVRENLAARFGEESCRIFSPCESAL